MARNHGEAPYQIVLVIGRQTHDTGCYGPLAEWRGGTFTPCSMWVRFLQGLPMNSVVKTPALRAYVRGEVQLFSVHLSSSSDMFG